MRLIDCFISVGKTREGSSTLIPVVIHRPLQWCRPEPSTSPWLSFTIELNHIVCAYKKLLIVICDLLSFVATSGWRLCWSCHMRWTSVERMFVGCSSSTLTLKAGWKTSLNLWIGPIRVGYVLHNRTVECTDSFYNFVKKLGNQRIWLFFCHFDTFYTDNYFLNSLHLTVCYNNCSFASYSISIQGSGLLRYRFAGTLCLASAWWIRGGRRSG